MAVGGGFGPPVDDPDELAQLASELETAAFEVRATLEAAPAVIREDLAATLSVAERLVTTTRDGGAGGASPQLSLNEAEEVSGERLFAYIEDHCHPLGLGVLEVMDGGYVPVGSQTTIMVAAAVADGTAVDITVHGPEGLVASLTATAADGVAAVPFTPEGVGLHEIVARSHDPNGRAMGLLTATDPNASIGPASAFDRHDTDGNGLFEQLTVDVPVVVDRPLEVRLVAQLSAPEHAFLGGSSTVADVAAGTTTVSLSWGTSGLSEQAVEGPITVRTVLLIDETTDDVLAFADSIGTSPTYDGSSWQTQSRPGRHVVVRLPDGREFHIDVGPGGDSGQSVAAFLSESLAILDPVSEGIPGALDYQGSGYVDAQALIFTPLAQLQDALQDWSFDLYDIDDDLVAEHLAVTASNSGDSWCIDIPQSSDQDVIHHTGECDVPSGVAPVGPPRQPEPDGP